MDEKPEAPPSDDVPPSPPPLSACTSPLECFKLMLAHLGAAITALAFHSRVFLLGKIAVMRVFVMTTLRTNLALIARSAMTFGGSAAGILGSRVLLVSNAARIAVRTYGFMMARLLLAFIVGVRTA